MVVQIKIAPIPAFPRRMAGRPEHTRANAAVWFWQFVDRDGPVPAHAPQLGACWPWTGLQDREYGRVHVCGGYRRAHRVAYELATGVPTAYVLHRCWFRPCCRPSHLYDGSPLQNTQDRREAGISTARSGARNHQAKLTDEAVVVIRNSAEGMSVLAKRYGVTRRVIWLVRTGRSYVDATGPVLR